MRRMNLPDSWGSHQREHRASRGLETPQKAAESSQNLASFITIIIITACARPLLAIATTGHCGVTSFSSDKASAT
jgi:hypothetical protein